MAPSSAIAEEFRHDYLLSLPSGERDRRFFEAFSSGATAECADHLAELVLRGVKTATSELLWWREASGKPLWKVGDEHIVLDGKGQPVCVIRTNELYIVPFDQVGDLFVRDYGEGSERSIGGGGTCGATTRTSVGKLGRTATPYMPLICERFEVVHSVPGG